MKNYLERSSFYTNVPKIMILCYTVPEIWLVTDTILIFHFGLFVAILLPKQPKIQKFQKNKKKYLEISFYSILRQHRILRQHPESLQRGTLSKVLPENTLTQHYFWKKGHFFVKYYCEGQRLTTDADFFWIIP